VLVEMAQARSGETKLAVTLAAAASVTVQVPLPLQPAPDQPAKVWPTPAAAVKVTSVPLWKVDVQPTVGQMMPAGLEVTVPVPLTLTVNPGAPKFAVTVPAALMATLQDGAAPQGADQPRNDEPAAGVAVSVTVLPYAKLALQVAPQLMPAGTDVTVPAPVGLETTVRVGVALKLAVTVAGALNATEVVAALPEALPPQVANALPAPGIAVRVTDRPEGKDPVQVPGQLMPAGEETTLPLPLTLTVSGELKVAVTGRPPSTVSVQAAVPVQRPLDQPAKLLPALGVAFSATVAPKPN
jgi:hypothetical protein